jgi:hypothetical protein
MDLPAEISRSGFPFQRYCASILSERGWRIEEEFPVVVTENSKQNPRKIETNGDILASKDVDDLQVNLAIECKARYGKAWNFLGTISPKGRTSRFPDFQLVENDIWNYYAAIAFEKWPIPVSSSSIGWEVGYNEGDNEKNEESKGNRVHKASLQAWTTAIGSLERDKSDAEDRRQIGDADPQYSVYIPIVFTEAKLFEVTIDTKKYNPEKIVGSQQEVSSILFNYGIPSNLRFNVDTPHPRGMDYYELNRADVLISNFQSIGPVADALLKIIPHTIDRQLALI